MKKVTSLLECRTAISDTLKVTFRIVKRYFNIVPFTLFIMVVTTMSGCKKSDPEKSPAVSYTHLTLPTNREV